MGVSLIITIIIIITIITLLALYYIMVPANPKAYAEKYGYKECKASSCGIMRKCPIGWKDLGQCGRPNVRKCGSVCLIGKPRLCCRK